MEVSVWFLQLPDFGLLSSCAQMQVEQLKLAGASGRFCVGSRVDKPTAFSHGMRHRVCGLMIVGILESCGVSLSVGVTGFSTLCAYPSVGGPEFFVCAVWCGLAFQYFLVVLCWNFTCYLNNVLYWNGGGMALFPFGVCCAGLLHCAPPLIRTPEG